VLTALQILVSLLALTCGPILLWRRRDNVLGYVAAALFVSTYVIPLRPALASERLDGATVARYADMLAVGAAAFLLGLALGGQIGARSSNKVPLTFSRPLSERVTALVAGRARWIAVAGALGLLAAFGLMGYIPFFTADRTSAKYGVGAYRAGFERGSLLFRFGLAAAAAILPVMLAVWWRRRRTLDLALACALLTLLFFSLSRDAAFTGPLIFAVALAVERRWSPAVIGAAVILVFSAGSLISLALLGGTGPLPGPAGQEVASRLASSTPDLRDHIWFVRGFEEQGEPTYGRTLLAGLALHETEWEPSTYALRTLTGFSELRELASGGLRLPAPLWGYSAFGWAGAAVFSAVSGVFAGWGFTKLRRLLTPALAGPHLALALTAAVAFYDGTYGVLVEAYFLTSSVFVRLAVAAAVGVAVRLVLVNGRKKVAGTIHAC